MGISPAAWKMGGTVELWPTNLILGVNHDKAQHGAHPWAPGVCLFLMLLLVLESTHLFFLIGNSNC